MTHTGPTTAEPPIRPVEIWAAGAVLWRAGDGGPELALVHRPRYDDWSFPKGKLDRGESMPVAAVREVAEETGQDARLGATLGDVRYDVPEGRKLVRYWVAQALGGEFTPGVETDELRWVGADRAEEMLTYPRDLEVLRRFTAVGVPASTVLLVRHAKAGSRRQWDGDDDLRPLSRSGRDQAGRLAELLPLFGPDRIVSAPAVRCRDTVAPLAAALGGVPVADEPLLGELGYWADPAAGVARLRALTVERGVTVVCSQGRVIPDVVAELIDASPHRFDVDPDNVPARKASTWVLTFTDDALRSADHYPHPSG